MLYCQIFIISTYCKLEFYSFKIKIICIIKGALLLINLSIFLRPSPVYFYRIFILVYQVDVSNLLFYWAASTPNKRLSNIKSKQQTFVRYLLVRRDHVTWSMSQTLSKSRVGMVFIIMRNNILNKKLYIKKKIKWQKRENFFSEEKWTVVSSLIYHYPLIIDKMSIDKNNFKKPHNRH